MTRSLHQFVAGFSTGDAISNEARLLRSLFRSWNLASDIFSEAGHIHPDWRREVKDAEAFAAVCRPEDTVLLQLSIGSPVNDVFRSLPCRKIIRYQNITPPDYFRGFNEPLVRRLEWGRRQARELAGLEAQVTAASRYNAEDLRSLGYREVRVLPLLFDMEFIRTRPDAATARKYRDGRRNILFVGRCAPNKRIDDLLRAFFYFQTFVEPASRLIVAGSTVGMDRYYALLRTLASELRLEQVVFAGAVSQGILTALYAAADLFLCMSEHEGVGIPLFESMV
ncbi:MAG: glycosyltransferase family 4 protein, partial [Lentisphaerae bacterium]|nr:glycosyltransferase family 4 protein [Lentisphaerota bacterium]